MQTATATAAKSAKVTKPTKPIKGVNATKSPAVEVSEKFTPPTLGGNVTPEFLCDELGEAREKKAYWEKAEAFFKEAMKARAKGTKSIIGDKFISMIEEQSRTTLDTTLVRGFLTEEQLAECERTTIFEKVTTKRR